MKSAWPTILLLLLSTSIAGTRSAWAQAIDRCNDVLQQDLFNKISSQSEQKQSAQQAQTAAFFSQDSSQAFNEYKKVRDDDKKQGTSGHLDGHYGFIGGAADFAHSYERDLHEDEFKKEFTEKQKMYQGSSSSSSASESSLIGIYSSSVRDANTIKAWETCMSRSSEAGLFAYGHRDKSGSPFITVLWVPGDMVGFATSINVRFVVPQTGVQIEASGLESEIGMGSGTAFALRFNDPNDRRAKTEGFAVLVNGQVKKDNSVVRSFQANAAVPDDISHAVTYGMGQPNACTRLFHENTKYRLVFLVPGLQENQKSDLAITIATGGRREAALSADARDAAEDGPPTGGRHPRVQFDAVYDVTFVFPSVPGFNHPPESGYMQLKDERVSFRSARDFFTGQCNQNQEVTGTLPLSGTRYVLKPL